MIGDVYIKLGSGKARRHHAGNKGALLDQAAHLGIKVPRGVLLLNTAWDQTRLMGLLEINSGRVHIPDAAALMKFLALPHFERPLAIRSAFSTEDGDEHSLAGRFETVLNVPPDDPQAVADALQRVLESGEGAFGSTRRDVLVMEMVGAKTAGVAFTEREHEDDLVNYVSGTAQDLMAGRVPGEAMPLAKLRNWESRLRGDALEPWQRRLQVLLKQVRRWMGATDWDIEWADDGQRCYLVQLRPVTAPTRRNEVFTIANHKEILPELPSVFMTSVIDSCAADLFAYYRQFDTNLPATRPFIEVFQGRPYINLSLMSEMMRIFGLPTRLVTDNIGGGTDRPYGLNLGRVLRNILRWKLPRFALAQLNAVRHVRATTATLEERLQDPGQTLSDQVDTLQWLYTALVTEMFSLTAAMGPLLSLLRGFGVLAEHQALSREQTINQRMDAELGRLRDIVARHAHVREPLAAGGLPEDDEFRTAWAAFLTRYGHRGVYESDIARPRYAEQADSLLATLIEPPPRRPARPSRSLLGFLTLPLWWQAGRAMRAREQWRHDAMRGFMAVRSALLAKADALVEAGRLPYAAALWMLDIDEVKALDGGWTPEHGFFMQRRREIAERRAYHLPDLLRRFDDLAAYRDEPPGQDGLLHLNGIGLTQGSISGRAWVLREPASHLPHGYLPDETILVARSVDAGWLPTFNRVAGVVVETGGDLSHGSIILREMGLPAVTNVSGATRGIRTGDMVHLDARTGAVERVPPGSG